MCIRDRDRYMGKIQHTYTGSTPVTEKMWQDLMKKAINATASSMVLANKYKQLKNRVQQTQAATSGTIVAMTSSVRTTQKQYVTSPKTKTASSPQTSAMKPVRTSTSQNKNKNQNWRVEGKRQPLPVVPVPVLQFQLPAKMARILAPSQDQKQKMF